MAVIRGSESISLKIKVETGITASGAPKYSARSIAHINPEATDEDVFNFGKGLAGLQACTLGGITRAENAELIEA